MRGVKPGKEFRLLVRSQRVAGAMLVTTIQRLISAFHEHFTPLDEARGRETSQGTKNDFLQKGGLHQPFWST